MKTDLKCLREFPTLVEDKRPGCLAKIGKATTTNAGTFPLLVPDGPTLTIKANTLFTLLSEREESKTAQDAYDTEFAADLKMMEIVYDYLDLVAQGSAAIYALAGVKTQSGNTSSIGTPNTPAALVFEFAKGAGEMMLERAFDKLALGSVTVTFTDPKITVVKSGDTQLTVTCADGAVLYIDIETIINILIENQVKGSEIMAVMALFNANGLSPVASPAPIVVPR